MRVFIGALLTATTLATLALVPEVSAQNANRAQPQTQRCNPPRPNLEYRAWYAECESMLQYLHRTQNPYGLPYTEYVRMLWQMYEVRYYPDRHPSLVGSQCSPEGSGYMNQSGHAQICRGGRWTVGGF
jgi:hypothetical protein